MVWQIPSLQLYQISLILSVFLVVIPPVISFQDFISLESAWNGVLNGNVATLTLTGNITIGDSDFLPLTGNRSIIIDGTGHGFIREASSDNAIFQWVYGGDSEGSTYTFKNMHQTDLEGGNSAKGSFLQVDDPDAPVNIIIEDSDFQNIKSKKGGVLFAKGENGTQPRPLHRHPASCHLTLLPTFQCVLS